VRSAADDGWKTRPAPAIVRRSAEKAGAAAIRPHRPDLASSPRLALRFRQRRRGDSERCAGGTSGRRRPPCSIAPLCGRATSCGWHPAAQPHVHSPGTSRAAIGRL